MRKGLDFSAVHALGVTEIVFDRNVVTPYVTIFGLLSKKMTYRTGERFAFSIFVKIKHRMYYAI
jgi:hypothetical protein